MRTIEQRANRQVQFASQLVEAIDGPHADVDEAKVLDLLRWLNDAGLRLAPAKDERVGLAVTWMSEAEKRAPRNPMEAIREFIDIIKSAGEAMLPGGGAVIVEMLKQPCEDPECAECQAFLEMATAVEVDAVTNAISHGHTLDEDCPVCKGEGS